MYCRFQWSFIHIYNVLKIWYLMKIARHLFSHFLIPDLILDKEKITRNNTGKTFTSLDTDGVILEKAEMKWQCLTTVLIGAWGSLVFSFVLIGAWESLVLSFLWCNSDIIGRVSFSAVIAASFTRALKSAPLRMKQQEYYIFLLLMD